MSSLTLTEKVKNHSKLYKTVEKATSLVLSIARYDLLKLSTHITEIVGCYIYTNIDDKYKIDKNALIVDIIADVYKLTDDEKQLVRQQVDDLVDRKIIRKLSMFRRFCSYARSFFVKNQPQ